MRTCIVCGCTDDNACVHDGGPGTEPITCEWVHEDGEPPLCSFCLMNGATTPEPRIILPGDPEYFL